MPSTSLVRRVGAPGASTEVAAARAMPTSSGSTASRWLGLGGIVTTSVVGRSGCSTRAPAWYFTSPIQPRSIRLLRAKSGSLNSARICA